MYSERFRHLKPYTPGEQPQDRKYIKLNTNEHPFPPSPKVIHTLRTFDEDKLRLYPDPDCVELRTAIAEYYGVAVENIFVGNGSDEVLSMIYYAFFDSSFGPLQMPDLSFSFYPVFANFHGVDIRTIPLRESFTIELEDYVSDGESCGTIFANPNAPTGLPVPRRDVGDLLKRYDSGRIVVSDEAYVEFGGETTVPLLKNHENLVIVNTCSKSRSLAGGRLGYAIAASEIIRALYSVKNSFNSYTVNAVTQAMGIAAFSDSDYYNVVNRKVVSTRDRTITAMEELGWQVLPSKANFIFASLPGTDGKNIYASFRNNGILVRYFDIERIRAFVRISVGSDADMDAVLSVASELPKSR